MFNVLSSENIAVQDKPKGAQNVPEINIDEDFDINRYQYRRPQTSKVGGVFRQRRLTDLNSPLENLSPTSENDFKVLAVTKSDIKKEMQFQFA